MPVAHPLLLLAPPLALCIRVHTGPRSSPTLWSFSSARLEPKERSELLREQAVGAHVRGKLSSSMGSARNKAASPRPKSANASPLKLASAATTPPLTGRGGSPRTAGDRPQESSRLARLSALPGDLLGWKPRHGQGLDDGQWDTLLDASLTTSEKQTQEDAPWLGDVSGYYRHRGQRNDSGDGRLGEMQLRERSPERPSPPKPQRQMGSITQSSNSWLKGQPRIDPRSPPKLRDDGEEKVSNASVPPPVHVRTSFESIRQDQAKRWAEINGKEEEGGGGDTGLVNESPPALAEVAASRRATAKADVIAKPTIDGEHWSDLEGLLRNDSLKLRVIDVFNALDKNGDGTVSQNEFCRGLVNQGASYVLSSKIANLFTEIDSDGSGTINYRELNGRLRGGNAVTLAEELRSGAIGRIDTRAQNAKSQASGWEARRLSRASTSGGAGAAGEPSAGSPPREEEEDTQGRPSGRSPNGREML